MIAAMIPGNASAAFMPNPPSSDDKVLSLFLSYSFKPFSSLGGKPSDAAVQSLPGINASMNTLITIPIAVSTEAVVMPCSLKSIQIFSDEVSLSNTLATISLKLVIWFVSLPLMRSILSCLTFKSPLSLLILFLISSSWSLL